MNKKILKLENNKEYFQISELVDNNINYLLLMNIDNESDIIIAKKVNENNEEYVIEVEDSSIIKNLKGKFKLLIDEDKKNLL